MDNNAAGSAFVPAITEDKAREYFERRRKGGILGCKEEIAELERRYAPLGVFDITRMEEIEDGILTTITKNIKKNNIFYVNLNGADLYYVGGDVFKRKLWVKSLDIIERIADLPLESIAILSDIVKHGEISHEDLNRMHFLFLNRCFDNILILQTRGLIEIKRRIFRSISLGYINNVDMPAFDDKGYNLKEFLRIDSITKDYGLDTIVYPLGDMSKVMGVFFGGDVELKGIVYIPYDRCKYTDKKNRFRYEILISPKFI